MPKKIFKNQQQYEKKMSSLNIIEKSNYGTFIDDLDKIPTVQNKKADFYRILGVPQDKKHLYSITSAQFKKALLTFFKNCTLEELMDPEVNDIAAVDTQMLRIAQGLLFDLIGKGEIKKAMPCFFLEETVREDEKNTLKFNSKFIGELDAIIDNMNELERKKNGECEDKTIFETIYEDKLQGDAFLRCAQRTENALSILNGQDKLQRLDISNPKIKKTLIDEAWNYHEIQKLRNSRSFGWKLFHPFKNRDEKQALSQLKESFMSRGVSEETLNGIASDDFHHFTEDRWISSMVTEINSKIEKDASKGEFSTEKLDIKNGDINLEYSKENNVNIEGPIRGKENLEIIKTERTS